MEEKLQASDLVCIGGGKATTTSVLVALAFSKQHKNVLQAIDALIADLPGHSRLNFQPSDYIDDRGKIQPAYEMDRDGFTLLAMGFTGKNALAWKLKYIDAFNKMEQALISAPIHTLPQTYSEALRLAADKQDEIDQQNKLIAYIQPKAELHDRLYDVEDTHCLRSAAKMLGKTERKFNAHLHTIGWIYRLGGVGNWVGTANAEKKDLVINKPDYYTKKDGSDGVRHQVRLTQKGLHALNEKFKQQELP